MAAFIPKKLSTPENLGNKLRQTRLFKNLKIEEVAKKLNIRQEYLVALEEEQYDKLPSGLYGKKFLKEYVLFLGLKPQEYLEFWHQENEIGFAINPFQQKIIKKSHFLIFPKIIKNILISLAVLICFLYLLFYFKKIFLPPNLTVTQPAKNLVTKENSLLITGQTEKEAEVKINGELVLNNHDGVFSQTVNLKKGLNSLVIKSKKKYSQEKIITRQILVE